MRDFLSQPWTVLACALLAVLFVCFSPWTTQDGPNHKKVALILSRLPESPIENRVYKNNLSLLQTNELFPALYQFVSKKISPQTYEKNFVAFFMAALILAYWLFLKTWSKSSLCFWPLILPLCFNPLIIRGFYNFLACLPLTLICLVLLKKGPESHKFLCWIAFSFFAWLAFLAHPFSSFVLLPVMSLMLLDKNTKKKTSFLPFLFTSFFFFGLGFLPNLIHSTQNESSLPLSFSPPWESLLGLFAWNVSGFHWLAFVLFVPFFIFLVRIAFISLKTVSWKNKKYWLAFLLLLFIFPLEASQGSFLNHRFLIFIWIFLPLGLETQNFSRWKGFSLCLATFISCMLLTAFAMQRSQMSLQDAKIVLEKLPEQSRLYSINFDSKNSALSMHPLMHEWANYPDAKVVLSPYLFAYSDLMPLVRLEPASETYFPATNESLPQEILSGEFCKKLKTDSDVSCEKQKSEALQEILQAASYYDYWLIHKAPDFFLKNLGNDASLEKLAESGETSLWHYKNSKNFIPNPFVSL